MRDLAGLLRNRAAPAALELTELRVNLLTFMKLLAMAVMLLWCALAYWSLLAVSLAWDTLGWKIVLIIAGAFTSAGLYRLHRANAG